MKKIVLSESQLKYITRRILSEEEVPDVPDVPNNKNQETTTQNTNISKRIPAENQYVDIVLKSKGRSSLGNRRADANEALAILGLARNTNQPVEYDEGEIATYVKSRMNTNIPQQTNQTTSGNTSSGTVSTSTANTVSNDTTSNSENIGSIDMAWLGDSQSVVSNGKWPSGVLPQLTNYGSSYLYFAMGSARPDHYSKGTQLKAPFATNIKSLDGKKYNTGDLCLRAKEYLLKLKPKYLFVALGHNGMRGFEELVSQFKSIGTRIILIEEFTTSAAEGTGMKSYNLDASKKLYVPYERMVDKYVSLLTDENGAELKIDKSKDGVHMSKAGADDAIKWTVYKLKQKT